MNELNRDGDAVVTQTGPSERLSTVVSISPGYLKYWLIANRYTRVGMARKLGVCKTTVRRWLSGKTSIPGWVYEVLSNLDNRLITYKTGNCAGLNYRP